jgi:hypothetical protein
MSASTTRVFGMKVGIDPKILVGGLIVVAGFLFWYNSRSDDVPSSPARSSVSARTDAPPGVVPAPAAPAPKARGSNARRSTSQLANDRGTLRLRPVDATRGDIDPTLHLDLLSRLRAVEQSPSTRSLFEIQATPLASTAPPIKGPVIMPKPLPGPAPSVAGASSGPPPLNIPLRYYGFVRPAEIGKTNSGLFLDGDNVLVASEGQVVKQRFLIVELTPTSARLEDTQLRQGQLIPVEPVANP